jgi:membrane-anchored mycosin MYCP
MAVTLAAGGSLLLPALAIAPGASTPVSTATASAASSFAARPVAEVARVPQPPPVDLSQLPTSSQPVALPGVRQIAQCVEGSEPAARGSAAAEPLWSQRAFRLPELWTASRGRSVRIAVIDTGVSRHPLLAGRLIAGGDFVAGGNGLRDCDGHGTAVAGIAAATADPDSGFAGVAPAAEIISIRQSSPSFTVSEPGRQEQPAGNLRTLASAVLRAVDLGAGVINISEVACASPNAAGAAELQAAIHQAVQRKVVVVAAAGNTGSGQHGECPSQPEPGTVVYPAWYDDEVLAVAAIGPSGLPSPFNYPGPWVDVAAPGERLVSLAATGSGLTDQLTGDPATPITGTSFAAPSVAGLAALIRARYPQLTAAQVVDRITATASQRAVGRSDTVGYGTVDPVAALTRTPAVLPTPGADPLGQRTGTLSLPPAPRRTPAEPGALFGGLLALLATATVGALAVAKLRSGNRR